MVPSSVPRYSLYLGFSLFRGCLYLMFFFGHKGNDAQNMYKTQNSITDFFVNEHFFQGASLKRSKQEYTKERRVSQRHNNSEKFVICKMSQQKNQKKKLYLKHKEGNSCNIPGTEKLIHMYIALC